MTISQSIVTINSDIFSINSDKFRFIDTWIFRPFKWMDILRKWIFKRFIVLSPMQRSVHYKILLQMPTFDLHQTKLIIVFKRKVFHYTFVRHQIYSDICIRRLPASFDIVSSVRQFRNRRTEGPGFPGPLPRLYQRTSALLLLHHFESQLWTAWGTWARGARTSCWPSTIQCRRR